MARVAGYCYDCRTNVRNAAEHPSTRKHRDALDARARETMALEPDGASFARRMRVGQSIDGGTAEANALAAARLGGYFGSVIVEDEPDAPDAWYTESAAPLPRRMARLSPCPRCGREDWRSKRGRDYHLTQNLECVRWRKPERHVYAMIGG